MQWKHARAADGFGGWIAYQGVTVTEEESILLARDGRKLTRDDGKLQCWVDHFSDVIRELEVSMVTLDVLLVL